MFNWTALGPIFKEDPVNCLIYIVTVVFVILLSLILHECAHGWMAFRCGDPTAKMLGRLSLNPMRHLDPIGSLCMLLFGFGWAKPVPVNPRNFENYRRDDFLVSVAGIVTNMTLCIICSLAAVLINMILWKTDWFPVLEHIHMMDVSAESLVNVFTSGSNEHVVPYIAYGISYEWLAPFTTHSWLLYVQRFLLIMARSNMALALFNLLPIPPLDGFHLLNDTLLRGKLTLNRTVFQITQIALIMLVLGTDLLDGLLTAGSEFVGGAIIRTFLMLTGQM